MQTPTTEKKKKPAPWRYRVRELLYALPDAERIRIKKRIIRECNISESSVSRYINVKKGDNYDMPALVLITFAHLLNVEVEELKN